MVRRQWAFRKLLECTPLPLVRPRRRLVQSTKKSLRGRVRRSILRSTNEGDGNVPPSWHGSVATNRICPCSLARLRLPMSRRSFGKRLQSFFDKEGVARDSEHRPGTLRGGRGGECPRKVY